MLFETTIHANDAGQRLDRYLKRILPNLNISRIYALIRMREVKLDGKPAKRGDSVSGGQVLKVFGLKETELSQNANAGFGGQGTKPGKAPQSRSGLSSTSVFYEDENLLVINKAPGVSVHPGSGVPLGASLVEQAWDYLEKSGGWGKSLFKPSLIHRIDRDTSGLVMLAKNGEALRWWSQQWRNRQVGKKYLAICIGNPPAKGTIRHELEKKEEARKGGRSKIGGDKSREAVTHFELLKTQGKLSLLRVKIDTGRMHQIRAHFGEEGYPLAGDVKYGNFALNRSLWKLGAPKRLYLHSHYLAGEDFNGKKLKWECPQPGAFGQCLEFGPGL